MPLIWDAIARLYRTSLLARTTLGILVDSAHDYGTSQLLRFVAPDKLIRDIDDLAEYSSIGCIDSLDHQRRKDQALSKWNDREVLWLVPSLDSHPILHQLPHEIGPLLDSRPTKVVKFQGETQEYTLEDDDIDHAYLAGCGKTQFAGKDLRFRGDFCPKAQQNFASA